MFFSDTAEVHGSSRQILTLLAAQGATILHPCHQVVSIFLLHAQGDGPVIHVVLAAQAQDVLVTLLRVG